MKAVVVEAAVQGYREHQGAIHYQAVESLHQTLHSSVGKEPSGTTHVHPIPT